MSLQPEEFRLNLAYGQLAGKWWGSKEKRPILLLHGWQDNAGSFDTLIPLLPTDFSYLAIDFPGHGFSSHLPRGSYYHFIDLVPILEEIRIKLKWQRLSIIAHSMGSIVAFFYASICPDNVDLVCALDTIKMQHYHPKFTSRIYTWRTKGLIKLVQDFKEQSPEYTYDELVERVHDGSMRSVDVDKTKYMINRGTRPSQNDPNKFCFTRDICTKFMQPFYAEQVIGLDYVKNIQAAYLFIKSSDRDFSEPEKNVRETVEQFRRSNKKFEYLRVKGTHHVHLNHPKLIADKIGQFIQKHHGHEEQHNDSIEIKCKL